MKPVVMRDYTKVTAAEKCEPPGLALSLLCRIPPPPFVDSVGPTVPLRRESPEEKN